MTIETKIPLPPPRTDGDCSIEKALAARRSVRDFAPAPLSLDAVAQLLWAAQGVTSPHGLRTAPSAGALYPLELCLAAGRVDGLPAGAYRYHPADHALHLHARDDLRRDLARAALRQSWLADAAAVLVIAAVASRTAAKYGARAERYVCMEVGHAAQNVYLQAHALGLATVLVGAFDDDALHRVLALPTEEQVLALMPLGAAQQPRVPASSGP